VSAATVPRPARAGASPHVGGVAVTGWSIHLPGADLTDLIDGCGPETACPADRAHELLGRKGLLGKEPATRLALCAVHRALDWPALTPRQAGPPDPRTAVVASSNLGNVATVHDIVRTVREGSGRDVSPLSAPNASSNVAASTIAIWFRLGGPNLMVCSGATSGLDAVALGSLLLHAGRADRVVVVGTEPDDEVATALHARRLAPDAARLRTGAACVILEPAGAATAGMALLSPVRAVPDQAVPAAPDGASGPEPVIIGPAAAAPGRIMVDLVDRVGDTYGALGVLQVALATAMLAGTKPHTPHAARVVCGDATDGWRVAQLTGRAPEGRADLR
jgi:3-oxoacyl-[acyl-carrier-protein] synthase II